MGRTEEKEQNVGAGTETAAPNYHLSLCALRNFGFGLCTANRSIHLFGPALPSTYIRGFTADRKMAARGPHQ